jgi:addiction module RelE/StbE family toxin
VTLRKARWTRRALRRLDRIGAVIAQDNPAAAERVVARLVAAASALAEHPSLGRTGRLTGTREPALADIPYILAYRVTAQSDVEILTVMHAAQQWPDAL